jgi:hypothetical protein
MKLTPKNWSIFQHYKDRCPPWIKLHRDLLNDREYMGLPLASKALAPLLWLLASEAKDGTFDASADELMFRLRLTQKEIEHGIKPLIDKGFFVVASGVLADRLQAAIPETETETETEKETKAETEKKHRASRLPQDWQPNDRMLAFCENERPDLNPIEVAATFRDYWHSQPGQKAVKADGEATWRNWVRNQRIAAKSPQRAAIGYRSQNELIAAELIAELKNA